MPLELSELMEALRKSTDDYAERLEPDGDWAPMVFIYKGEKVSMMMIPMPDNHMRDLFFGSVLPNAIKEVEPEPDGIIMLNSTWFMAFEPGDVEKGLTPGEIVERHGLPSEQDNRREGILITGVMHEDEQMMFA